MRPTTSSTVILALVAGACESGTGPAHPPVAPSAAAPAHERRDAARAHHAAAAELELAIVHGRLTDARDLGGWIAANAEPRTDALIAAARRIEVARDVPAAAAMIGDLAYACAACHEQRGVRPTFRFPPAPDAWPDIAVQMHRHQWAAARLWEGVTGPDDVAWSAGASVLTTTAIDLGATTHAKPNEDVVELAEIMQVLATRALDTHEPAPRARLYANMLETCASCHAIVRPRAVAIGTPGR